MKQSLLIWNAMASRQVSGGDMYIKKFIENSDSKYDIVLSEHASGILEKNSNNRLFITDSKEAVGSLALLYLYTKRIIKALFIVKRQKNNYDSVIASSPFLPDIIPAIAKKSKNRVVVLFHLVPKRNAKDLRTKIRFSIARFEQKVALVLIGKFFSTILAGNIVVQEELQRKFPNKKIVIAHAGIDTDLIDKFSANKKDKNLGVFVGRLTTQKGILDIVDIAKYMADKQPDFKIIVVGDGQDRNIFTQRIKEEKVDNIILKGFVDQKTKYQLMKQASFFIFPSYEEGWGIALAEALYTNSLVFCYELPHYRSIFSSYPIYCKLGDWLDMARKMDKNYLNKPASDQTKYISRYQDRKVIKQVLAEL
ncbi:MAG: glycosyltransferase family 4 protein [Candidatus Saccharibacteria bacterium]|nr:glycosyltransferase family 4 protein [Candidatus Saccharibacteria bacterium]